jgi:fatty acid desaturase
MQTEGTVSFRTGSIGRFLCSGLEYQIEHHLFPNISHVYYPEVSAAVQSFCAERGLSYRSFSWPVALWKSWRVLRYPPQVFGWENRPITPPITQDGTLNVALLQQTVSESTGGL